MKREDTENLKRENYIALCSEFVLEEATDLFWDRLRNK